MLQQIDKSCQQRTIAEKKDSAKNCSTPIFLCIVAFTFVFLTVALEALGSLFIFDFRNSATDDNYIYNKEPSTPSSIKCINSANDFDRDYALSDTNRGIRSNMGLLINRGITTPTLVDSYFSTSSNLDIFNDHDTNSFSIRFYANPLFILPNPVDGILAGILIIFECLYGLWIQYSGTEGFKFVYVHADILTGDPYFYYVSSLPLISTPTWIDATLVYQFVQNLPGNIKMSEIVFSSGYKSSLPQTVTTILNFDYPLSDVVQEFGFGITNSHFADMTIQYISIFGGETTAGSLSSVLCPNPTLIPPEYCSNPTTLFLANGCAASVGGRCKRQCNLNFCRPISSSNYSSPLSSSQVAGVAIGVSVAVDTVLIGIYTVLILCSLI